MEIEDYILEHISPEPPELNRLNRETHIKHLYGRMCSGHLQGRILKMLTSMIRPKKILELGTFTGYSALCFAEGMPDGGELHTVELDDEMEDELRGRFGNNEKADHIFLHIGDALEVIKTFDCEFDLVFIDANKRNYVEYFEAVMPKVSKGGFILADNTLWDGKVLHPEVNHDQQTEGVMQFNNLVARDPRVETVILPLRDGLTLMRKL